MSIVVTCVLYILINQIISAFISNYCSILCRVSSRSLFFVAASAVSSIFLGIRFATGQSDSSYVTATVADGFEFLATGKQRNRRSSQLF